MKSGDAMSSYTGNALGAIFLASYLLAVPASAQQSQKKESSLHFYLMGKGVTVQQNDNGRSTTSYRGARPGDAYQFGAMPQNGGFTLRYGNKYGMANKRIDAKAVAGAVEKAKMSVKRQLDKGFEIPWPAKK
jgi:hypothetical protein